MRIKVIFINDIDANVRIPYNIEAIKKEKMNDKQDREFSIAR